LLHATADRQAGRMQEAEKPMWCGARLCSGERRLQRKKSRILRLLCSPKKIQMAIDGAWCYEWRSAVRSGRDGEEVEEGRAGQAVMCTLGSKQHGCVESA
jgi:hypothetical protein